MSKPVGFPVPPDDLRFLERAARSRAPPPPRQARDPPERTRASVAANELLRQYMRRARGPIPRPALSKKQKKLKPKRAAAVTCVVLAATLIPFELIYFMTCRPELTGRRIRARMITPRDVERVLFLRSLPAATLLNRLRI